MSGIVERLRLTSSYRNERWQCIASPAMLTEAADTIEELASGFSLSIQMLERIGGIAPSEWAMTESWKAAIAKATASSDKGGE